MDRRATKDNGELEDEETERLVRPAPKVKPPRHDKRRERIETDKDPDLDTSDKDLSKNFKDIGGSIGSRVLSRWAKDSLPGEGVAQKIKKPKSKKVRVRNKETGWVGPVSEETVKESPGTYEAVDEEEDETAPKETAPKEKKQPKKPKNQGPIGTPAEYEAKKALEDYAREDPQFDTLMKGVADPNNTNFAPLIRGNPDMSVAPFFKGKTAPPGVSTIKDLYRVLTLGDQPKAKPEKKPKPEAPAKSEAPPKQEQPKVQQAPAVEPKNEKNPAQGLAKPKPLEPGQGKPVAPAPAGKDVVTPASPKPGEEAKPKEEAPAPTVPQKRPVSKAEEHAAINLLTHSFPTAVAAKLMMSNPPLHPDEVHALVSDYNVAKSIDVPTDKLDSLREKASKFYATDPNSVPPPKTAKAKDGSVVPFEQLPPIEQAEELRKHQIKTVAMSLAAKEAISQNLQKKAKAPQALADAMSDFMLTGTDESPEERQTRAAHRAEALFYNTIGASAPQPEQPDSEEESAPAPVAPEQAQPQTEEAPEAKPAEKGKDGKAKSKKPKPKALPKEKKPKEKNRFDQDLDSLTKQAEAPPVSDRDIKKILSASKDPAVQRLAVGYFQAQDYKEARKKFLQPDAVESVSEFQPPDVIAKRLIKAGDFLRSKAERYPSNLLSQDTALTFKTRVMKQISTLAPSKQSRVQELLDEDDNKQYEKAAKHYPKELSKYLKHESQAEKESAEDYAKYSEQLKNGAKDLDPPLSASERLANMGIVKPQEPVKPPRYDLQRNKPEELSKSAEGLWDDFSSRTASGRLIASRVVVRHLGHPFSTYPNPFAMGRTAVYWGIAPNQTEPYASWEQPASRDLGEDDFARILKSAKGWLKSSMLSAPFEGIVRDTQLRAALDLAIRTENYDAALHPTQYNNLLARLAGVSEDETLLTVTASKTARNTMSNKVEFDPAQAEKFLARLDRIASVVQENHEAWGMKFEAAKALVNQIDKLADELESATFGADSMTRRQASVLGIKTAEVVQRDSDEKYMDTFKNPMAPVQTEADEPYMQAYADDQSSAVDHGKSTTGRPLAP
jgi:hypothetical protein